MADNVSDSVSLHGKAQATFTLSTTADQGSALLSGIYDVWSDVDCFVKVSEAASTGLTTSTGYLLRANNTVAMDIPDQKKIGAIVAAGTGNIYYHRVK